jgi:hypothetical protein
MSFGQSPALALEGLDALDLSRNDKPPSTDPLTGQRPSFEQSPDVIRVIAKLISCFGCCQRAFHIFD